MGRKRPIYHVLLALPLLLALNLAACSSDSEGPTESELLLGMNNCTGCHLDADQLVATAAHEEEDEDEEAGEG
ncbi:MAG: hypothetical protein R6W82_08890 [bacterium]